MPNDRTDGGAAETGKEVTTFVVYHDRRLLVSAVE